MGKRGHCWQSVSELHSSWPRSGCNPRKTYPQKMRLRENIRLPIFPAVSAVSIAEIIMVLKVEVKSMNEMTVKC